VVYYYLDRLRRHFSTEDKYAARRGDAHSAAPAAAKELTFGDGE
jgi:hypothetical protein